MFRLKQQRTLGESVKKYDCCFFFDFLVSLSKSSVPLLVNLYILDGKKRIHTKWQAHQYNFRDPKLLPWQIIAQVIHSFSVFFCFFWCFRFGSVSFWAFPCLLASLKWFSKTFSPGWAWACTFTWYSLLFRSNFGARCCYWLIFDWIFSPGVRFVIFGWNYNFDPSATTEPPQAANQFKHESRKKQQKCVKSRNCLHLSLAIFAISNFVFAYASADTHICVE